MGEHYKIGQFGHASFKIKKKGVAITGISAYGFITDQDEKNIEFTDNEGYSFIVPKYRFKFIEETFAPQTINK